MDFKSTNHRLFYEEKSRNSFSSWPCQNLIEPVGSVLALCVPQHSSPNNVGLTELVRAHVSKGKLLR